MVGNPHTGSLLFEREGCAHCHSVNGFGGQLAPDLGYEGEPRSGINALVSAMWNHAPRMWERIRAENLGYPDLGIEEMAHLFAFLYTARYVDEPGDRNKDQALFQKKGCARCHSVNGGGRVGPDLAAVKGVDTPIRWTEAMWNHAPAMETAAQQMGIAWPRFEDREMNDLVAYIRASSSAMRRESELLPADPDRGWKIFRTKSCIVCHSVKGKGGRAGSELGPNHRRPFTVVQFSALMWNHSPEMWKAPEVPAIPRPTFQGQEIADLVAFLSSLQFFEPLGSQHTGETIFGERGCDTCQQAWRRRQARSGLTRPRSACHHHYAGHRALAARAENVPGNATAWPPLAHAAGD
jgi:mono/diheme cytochrome c family protein